jgi:hypothetical protein
MRPSFHAARVPLRPRGSAEILDLALAFIRAHGGVYAKLCAVSLLPVLGLCVLLRHGARFEWLPVWLAAAAGSVLVEGLFAVAAGRLLFNGAASATGAVRRFAGRATVSTGALLVAGMLVAVSFLLVLPAAIVAPRLLLVREACLLAQAGVREALARSWRLTRRHYGSAAMALALGLAVRLYAVLAAELLGDSAISFVLQLGHPFGELTEGGSAFAIAGFLLATPIVATARFLHYLDLRTRIEGWDIQVRFLALLAAMEHPSSWAAPGSARRPEARP